MNTEPSYKFIRDKKSLKIDDPIFAFVNQAPEYCFVHKELDTETSTFQVKKLDGTILEASETEVCSILIDSRHLREICFEHKSGDRLSFWVFGDVKVSAVYKHDTTQIFCGLRFINQIKELEEDGENLTAKELDEKYQRVEELHLLRRKFDNSDLELQRFDHNVLLLLRKMQGL